MNLDSILFEVTGNRKDESNMQYKDKKGSVWSFIKFDDNESEWIWAVKVIDENGKKTYNWEPRRIKLDWLELTT